MAEILPIWRKTLSNQSNQISRDGYIGIIRKRIYSEKKNDNVIMPKPVNYFDFILH